ncbi:hypothetical protein [Streptomyces sp. NPDC018045]|uniref:hypothetical protein n=1 Tax=Streptomyces sp. NPDC018045 TaxID=3365037 RepID=UPI0037BC19F1
MTWTHPADTAPARHTGYCRGVLADGTIAQYQRGGARIDRRFTDDPQAPGGTWDGPDAATLPLPRALEPACSCGWTGVRVAFDPDGGRHDTPYGDRWDWAGDDARREWTWHAEAVFRTDLPQTTRQPLAALAAVLGELAAERPRAALAAVRRLRALADLAEPLAVAHAQAHGVTWQAIGADLDQTRQNVNGRYANPSNTLENRVHRLTGDGVAALLAAARTARPGAPPPGLAGWADAARAALDDTARTDPPQEPAA